MTVIGWLYHDVLRGIGTLSVIGIIGAGQSAG
jgi:hypothetical protein